VGLDNYPEPRPCEILEKAGKLRIARVEDGRIDCRETDCPFKKIRKVVGLLGSYCWIRGKAYNEYAEEVGYSLYDDLGRPELEDLLRRLRARYGDGSDEDRIAGAIHGERDYVYDLMGYLEALLSVEEWDGKLIAWA